MPRRQLFPPAKRGALHPAVNATTVTVAAGFAEGLTQVLTAYVPALAPARFILMPLMVGGFGALGNWSRTKGGKWKRVFGWIG